MLFIYMLLVARALGGLTLAAGAARRGRMLLGSVAAPAAGLLGRRLAFLVAIFAIKLLILQPLLLLLCLVFGRRHLTRRALALSARDGRLSQITSVTKHIRHKRQPAPCIGGKTQSF